MQKLYKEDYQMKMLRFNTLPSLLPVTGIGVDDKSRYIYEIGMKRSLKDVFVKGKVDNDDLQLLLQGILEVLDEIEQYLLHPHRIYFDPEYIFLGHDRYFFCYFPEKKNRLSKEFHELSQFLVDHVNYEDEAAVERAYELFQKSDVPGFHIAQLVKEVLLLEGVTQRESYHVEEIVLDEITVKDGPTIVKKKKRNPFSFKKKNKYGEFDSLILEVEE